MTPSETKKRILDEHQNDLNLAYMNISWYENEMVCQRYNSFNHAADSLKIWKERLEQLERKTKQLNEMFAIYDDWLTKNKT